jgi:ABC-2 type transport system ATP-binding protein
MSEFALEVQSVSKTFGTKPAVKSVSFGARTGEITGFLGPNGAGKTTTLRMALGIIAPDSGSVRLFGAEPTARAFDRVGFLPEERGVYRKMTARQIITLFGRLKGMPARQARTRALELLERFSLGDAADKKIKELSKGMAQKVQILSAIVHQPDFIILDEPFSGLDPVNQGVLEAMIREQADAGATILFSTHVMQHAERLCDRIVLMARGEKVFDGRVEEALAVVPRQVDLGVDPGQELTALLTPFGAVSRAGTDSEGMAIWRVVLNGKSTPQDLLKACVDAGIALSRFEPLRPHLHDAFVQLVSDPADTLAERA